MLQLADLAHDIGIGQPTAEKWLSLLVSSGIVNRNEIDLILEADGKLHPIEIKKSANPGKDAIAAFRVLANVGKSLGLGGVVCCATERLPRRR